MSSDGERLSAAMAYMRHALCTYAPANLEASPATHEPPAYPHWPWAPDLFQPGPFTIAGSIGDLEKALALVADEIDLLAAVPAVGVEPDGDAEKKLEARFLGLLRNGSGLLSTERLLLAGLLVDAVYAAGWTAPAVVVGTATEPVETDDA